MKGRDKHIARLKRLSGPAVIKAAGGVAYVGADMIRAEAFRSVSAGSVSGKGHVPSAPGEPPNRDTGTLQDGFKSERTGPLSAEFRAETPYSEDLEFGNSKIAERPFVRPARDKEAPRIQRLFEVEIGKLVKGSGR